MRLFVAIDIPEPEYIRTVQTPLGDVRGVRLTSPYDAHLTLKFLGEVPDISLGDLRARLGHIVARPFTLTIEGIGGFPGLRDPRVLYLCAQGPEGLTDLARRVDAATPNIPVDKPFRPHITIARCTGPVDTSRLFAPRIEVPVHEFALYQSVNESGRTAYRVLARFPLSH